MDDLFSLHPNGLFLRGEALDHGYSDRDLAIARRMGHVHRIRQGAYLPAGGWAMATAEAKFRMHGQAVLLSHHDSVALSHVSGVAELGLPLWGQPLSHVHVTRLDGAPGRHRDDVIYHQGAWGPEDIWSKEEMLLLGPTSCALGAAALGTVESAVVLLDALIEADLATPESVRSAYAARQRWPHTRKLQVAVRLTRRGAQSVGESRSRYLFWTQHLPEPVLQYEVRDETGRLIGITDFAWPELRLLGEFDGKSKYGRLLVPGQDPAEVVYREKLREDRLREVTGFSMIRFTWNDLYHPGATAARTRHLMGRNAA